VSAFCSTLGSNRSDDVHVLRALLKLCAMSPDAWRFGRSVSGTASLEKLHLSAVECRLDPKPHQERKTYLQSAIAKTVDAMQSSTAGPHLSAAHTVKTLAVTALAVYRLFRLDACA